MSIMRETYSWIGVLPASSVESRIISRYHYTHGCLSGVILDSIHRIVQHCKNELNITYPLCSHLLQVYHFHIFHHELPSMEQFDIYTTNLDTMGDYHTQRVSTPTENLNLLPRMKIMSPSELMCSICQTEFRTGDEVYKIPSCNHIFHMNNCLHESSNIITWLQRNNTCPNCITQVHIPDPDATEM